MFGLFATKDFLDLGEYHDSLYFGSIYGSIPKFTLNLKKIHSDHMLNNLAKNYGKPYLSYIDI